MTRPAYWTFAVLSLLITLSSLRGLIAPLSLVMPNMAHFLTEAPWRLWGHILGGPLALALLGLDMKWMASTPGLLAGSYSESLISTTGTTELEVVRQSLTALQRGQGLVVALDGAVNLAAPTVDFLGQRIAFVQ